MDEAQSQNEEQEHTNAWQAADNVAQSASNTVQAADNVKQTAANVAQTQANVKQTDVNVQKTEAAMEEQAAANDKQNAINRAQNATNAKQNASHRKRRKINYVQSSVYAFLALVVILAFYLNDSNQKADEKARCIAGVDTRNVDRAQAQGFYVFVAGLLPSPNQVRQLPIEDQRQVRKTQKKLIKYRKDLYNLIHPAAICAKYVNDDHVTPPKSPKITIVIPKKGATS